MKVTCIATGSSGNCFYCESEKGTGVFLDAGAPPKAILDMGLSIANKPFFVTHEHGDHAKYARELTYKYGAQIIGTEGTLNSIGIPIRWEADFTQIPIIHNAEEPCAFLLEIDGESVLYIMDAGQVPDVKHLRPEVLIVEANYTQKRMEENARNSASGLYVSGRVSSGFGHLSVNQAVEIALPMFPTLELLLFAHMSRSNFDMMEYFNDETIPDPIKRNARFAEPGRTYSTVPF